MKKKSSFLKRNKLLFMFFGLMLMYVFYNTHHYRIHRDTLFDEREILVQQILEVEHDLERLRDQANAVQTIEHVEKVAREKLKMVRANEIVFFISQTEEQEEGDE